MPVILPLTELSQLQDALQVTAKIQFMMCGFLIDQKWPGDELFSPGICWIGFGMNLSGSDVQILRMYS
ncbi:hypothetical protein [Paracoccus aestuarii]|uniref:hypothetical protein n=1 Tax=Paracoccus aestuarii TaxID=453842 RepID=UPI0014746413|nr:hypothetical protein [Paracoccus aestuarii]WCQ99871.1 hypothetical protein JHW48_03855 [Paracoccus aestuarii]